MDIERPKPLQQKTLRCRRADMWTCGDSNPGYIHAMDAYYRYTTGPYILFLVFPTIPLKFSRKKNQYGTLLYNLTFSTACQ